MNNKRNNKLIISLLLLAALIVTVAVCIYKYVGEGTKEKTAAKTFITTLVDNEMIDNNVDMKKCVAAKKSDPSKAEEYYSVNIDKYAIDIDANYNVIGFNNQNSRAEDNNVTVEQCRVLAERYLKNLYDGECEFEEIVKEEESQKMPYYTLIYAKCKDKIPFYNYNLSLKINKETGKLDGFSNASINIEPKEGIVNIGKQEAENTAIEAFSKLNTYINMVEETYKSYCEDKDKTELELCYIVTLKGLDSSSKDVKMKYFVSTETGEIINSEKSNVKTIIS